MKPSLIAKLRQVGAERGLGSNNGKMVKEKRVKVMTSRNWKGHSDGGGFQVEVFAFLDRNAQYFPKTSRFLGDFRPF